MTVAVARAPPPTSRLGMIIRMAHVIFTIIIIIYYNIKYNNNIKAIIHSKAKYNK